MLRKIWNWRLSKGERGSLRARAGRGLFFFFALMLCCTVVSRAADALTVAEVTAEPPARGPITHTVTLDGTLEPGERTPVLCPEGYIVLETRFQEGDPVKEGDLLYRVDIGPLLSEISKKQLEAEAARLRLEEQLQKDAQSEEEGDTGIRRAREDYTYAAKTAALKVSGAAEEMRRARQDLRDYTGDESDRNGDRYDEDDDPAYRALREAYREKKRLYEQAMADHDEAVNKAERALIDAQKAQDSPVSGTAGKLLDLELQTRELELQELKAKAAFGGEVYAPCDGIVSEPNVAPGKPSGGEAMYLTDPLGLTFTAEADEEQMKHIGERSPVALTLGGTQKEFSSLSIEALKPLADKAGCTQIRVPVPAGEGSPGLYASAVIRERTAAFSACVPLSALYSDGPQMYVFVIRERETALGTESFAQRVDVTIQDRNESAAAVDGPLSPDDRVITGSARALSDGDRVRLAAP